MQQPREAHLKAVKHIIRYIKGTVHYGIKYKKVSGSNLMGYSDSNFTTADSEDGKTTSGIVFYYNGCPFHGNHKNNPPLHYQAVRRSSLQPLLQHVKQYGFMVCWWKSQEKNKR